MSVRSATMAAFAIGIFSAAFYYRHDLTLSHYDAKAHIVVARRILDSLQPGWVQIGAVWLPLPHLLNALPVQVDWLYRTGLSGVALSVFSFVLGASALWWLVRRATNSAIGAWTAFAVFTAQPDVLYLQATPMTESLLMGLCLFSIACIWSAVARRGHGHVWPGGVALGLACLTRYEAWPISVAVVALAAIALTCLRMAPFQVIRRVLALAAFPAIAILAFLVLSKVTVGAWLVTGGFFEVDTSLQRRPVKVLGAIVYGIRTLNGDIALAVCAISLLIMCHAILRTRRGIPLLIVLSLWACLALPAYAFWSGHPFRIRYMVPFTMVLAAINGLGVGLLPRYRLLAAVTVVVAALVETPPLSRTSPIVLEAQRDRPNALERMKVTDCLTENYDHTLILASMGSLAPYMQETAHKGFGIRQYIHEGIWPIWNESLIAARHHAGWILIEEHAEGGDVLARLRQRSATFLEGFERVCEGGGVALYQRTATELPTSAVN